MVAIANFLMSIFLIRDVVKHYLPNPISLFYTLMLLTNGLIYISEIATNTMIQQLFEHWALSIKIVFAYSFVLIIKEFMLINIRVSWRYFSFLMALSIFSVLFTRHIQAILTVGIIFDILYWIILLIGFKNISFKDVTFSRLSLITKLHLGLLIVGLFFPLMGTVGFIISPNVGLIVVKNAISIAVIIHFILREFWSIDLVQMKESVQEAYTTSVLEKIDIGAVDKTIEKLMENEKIYLNQEIDLNSFAQQLQLTKHQLSEYINVYKNSNFNMFINMYRIEYAKGLLKKHPEYTTLAIGYMSGFNSFSTFNHSFKKIAQCSPHNYRKVHTDNASK